MRNLTLRKIILWIIVIVLGYHVIFGTARAIEDFKWPNGWYNETIQAFGDRLRILIASRPNQKIPWTMVDMQPEEQSDIRTGFIATHLDSNVYDYEMEMGWFYQYKVLYVLGRDGFWIIQADPFHITLLRNENIPDKDSQDLDESIAKYEKYRKQFTQAYSAAELTSEERKAYIKLQEKAQPRIQELKELGLYP